MPPTDQSIKCRLISGSFSWLTEHCQAKGGIFPHRHKVLLFFWTTDTFFFFCFILCTWLAFKFLLEKALAWCQQLWLSVIFSAEHWLKFKLQPHAQHASVSKQIKCICIWIELSFSHPHPIFLSVTHTNTHTHMHTQRRQHPKPEALAKKGITTSLTLEDHGCKQLA